VVLTYSWLVDGADPGPTGVVLTDEYLSVGAAVQCVATPNDGTEDGEPGVSDPVTVEAAGCPAGSGEEPDCPGISCLTILQGGFSVGDGEYWIDPMGTGAFQAYCDQTTDGGGWTRIVNHDYATDTCPGAWVHSTQYGGMCVRDSTSSADFIRSATFDVWDIEYTELRGHLAGHQFASCDAFGDAPPTSIDDTYGDVVSFTIGAAGARTHLFSYVCGYGTNSSDDSNCPNQPGGAPPHGWVGQDYACESGNATGGSPGSQWHPQIMFANHWFQSSVGATTTQDVEGRLVATHGSANEELGVIELVLYVR